MTFGAMPIWQGLLLIAASAAAAYFFFRMKVRPPRVQVPTLLLWRRVFDQTREMTWWERVRRAVSMAATILIAVALALAVTRPGPASGPASRGRTLIVIDSSWSMAARTSTGETRWQRAVRQARRLAAAAGGSDVALATTAEGLVEGPTADLALIETAIDRLTPAGAEDGPWPRVPGADHVHFITDGATPRTPDQGVEIHSVYESAPNVAVLAFGARPASAGAPAGEAYVKIANFSPAGQKVRASVARGANVIWSQDVDLAAGEAVSQVVPLPAEGGPRLRATVEAPDDALAADNEAFAWIEGAETIDVTVVTNDAAGAGLLFRADPRLRPTFVAPDQYKGAESGILVFDRWLPDQAPGRPGLIIAPPSSGWLGERGTEERAARWSAPGTHAAVAGVDPHSVDVKKVFAFTGKDLTVVAASERGTPLVSVADARDRRLVVWSFALADTNLKNAAGFPILLGDAIEWLAHPSYGVLRKPGLVRLPASTSRVISPAGQPVTVVRAGSDAIVRFKTPGLYLVEAAGSRGVVGVNVGDPEISNIGRTSLEGASVSYVEAGGAGWPWWMWFVVLAFALAATEWWTWQRRVTV
jgi:hypothetical protein